MLLRLPSDGSWVGSLLSNLGGPVTAEGSAVDVISGAQLLEVIDAMALG